MPAFHEDKDRKVVPRWRESADTMQSGELGPLRVQTRESLLDSSLLDERIKEWRRRKTPTFGAEVVSTAIVLDRKDAAADAATYLLASEHHLPPTTMRLARFVLGEATSAEADWSGLAMTERATIDRMKCRIGRLRSRLKAYPRNALGWVNLALMYINLGSADKGRAATLTALGLAPHDRFVLRSAARFFLHQDEYDRAHDLLRFNARTPTDPWLLSAEIALASAAERQSKLVKKGVKIVQSGNLAPFHLSELASAIGTLDFESGNRRRARKMFDAALVDPTENTVAQAAWIGRQIGGLELSPEGTGSHEADAVRLSQAGRWAESVESASLWLADQSFSSRPSILGSYAAATGLMDFEAAARIAERGLIANPTNVTLLNNSAFALARLGHVEEARVQLSRIKMADTDEYGEVAIRATSGLVAFRRGNSEEGRRLYRSAIDRAQSLGLRKHAALAEIWLAFEEVQSAGRGAEVVGVAEAAARGIDAAEVATLLGRLKAVVPGNPSTKR